MKVELEIEVGEGRGRGRRKIVARKHEKKVMN